MEILKISLEYLQCDIEIKPPPFEGREEDNTHTHIVIYKVTSLLQHLHTRTIPLYWEILK